MIPTNKTECCNVEMRQTMGTVVLVKAEPQDYYNMSFCPFCGTKVGGDGMTVKRWCRECGRACAFDQIHPPDY